jgi:hypothetical protein
MSFSAADERQVDALKNCEDEGQATWQAMVSHPRMAWMCRLYEVIQAQEDTLPVFKADDVNLYAIEIMQDFVMEMDFTFEATLLIRTLLESFVVETARKASKLLENNNRIVLKASDWKLVSQW